MLEDITFFFPALWSGSTANPVDCDRATAVWLEVAKQAGYIPVLIGKPIGFVHDPVGELHTARAMLGLVRVEGILYVVIAVDMYQDLPEVTITSRRVAEDEDLDAYFERVTA